MILYVSSNLVKSIKSFSASYDSKENGRRNFRRTTFDAVIAQTVACHSDQQRSTPAENLISFPFLKMKETLPSPIASLSFAR